MDDPAEDLSGIASGFARTAAASRPILSSEVVRLGQVDERLVATEVLVGGEQANVVVDADVPSVVHGRRRKPADVHPPDGGAAVLQPQRFERGDVFDAPLDEANVGRFCGVVRELSDRTQFIVITHNKRTMEIADRLYGVTMQQRGVSKLVSVNLRRAVADASFS